VNKLDLVKKILLFGLITFVTGQIYFYPFGTDFRLALSPVTFAFTLLYFSDMPVVISAFIVSLFVFLGRFFLEYFNHNLQIIAIVVKHYPGGMYYLLYGLFFYLLDVRKHAEKPLLIIILLTASDSLSNVIELVIRNQILNDIPVVVSSLLIVALLRNFITVIGYWSIKLYNVLILKKAHYNRYLELLIFISNLKAELFYLKKSMQDIEKVMRNSYSMYMHINNLADTNNCKELQPYKMQALSLARDIHEIKKDYQRVITGIEKLLPNPVQNERMSISEIFEIIRNNSKRYIDSIGREIKLKFSSSDNYYTREYYSLVSILNNLIFNAIDAAGENGEIRVREFTQNSYVVIEVSDNGSGIPKEDLEVIFEPGYSTKYDEETGTMSTGLGLTHVKSIVEYLNGEISVDSTPGKGTVFTIHIPIAKITGKGE
jgi:two-component system sensor histidine kinase YcbA